MNNSYDLKHRILNFKGRLVHLYFLASLSNDVLISRLVEGIENREGKDLENCINMGDVEIAVSYTHLTLPTNREVEI